MTTDFVIATAGLLVAAAALAIATYNRIEIHHCKLGIFELCAEVFGCKEIAETVAELEKEEKPKAKKPAKKAPAKKAAKKTTKKTAKKTTKKETK